MAAFNPGGSAPPNRPFADPTINFYLAPGDELVQCPYYQHKILRARLSTHLSKCMSQYKKEMARNSQLPKYVICKHNWTHHVKEADLANHVANDCEDARKELLRNEMESKVEFPKFDTGMSGCGTSASVISFASTCDEVSVDVVPDSDTTESIVSGGMESDLFSSRSESSQFTKAPNPKKLKNSMDGRAATRAVATGKEEDWDQDSQLRVAHNFTQEKALEGKHVYFIPPGKSKSERIAYRKRMVELYSEKMRLTGENATEQDREHDPVARAMEATEAEAWDRAIEEERLTYAASAAGRKLALRKSQKEEGGDESQGVPASFLTPFLYDYDVKPTPMPPP